MSQMCPIGDVRGRAQRKWPPTEAALLLFEFSDLLAEFFFHTADHLRRGAVWELFPQTRGIWRVWFLLPAFLESDP